MSTASRFPAIAGACVALAGFGLACGKTPVSPSQPAFAVTSVSPVSGSDGVSTAVHVYGRGFSADVVVQIDGVVIPGTLVSATDIGLTMPPHAAGFVDVTATNAAHETSTLARAFRYDHVFPPVVTGISPAAGSTEGFGIVNLSGTGFQSDTTVTIDSFAAPDPEYSPAGYGSKRSSTFLPIWVPPHAAGSVDVVVRNHDGQTQRIPGGYTYAPPETFDFNGVWKGFTWETEFAISVTIQNNQLVSVTCGTVTHAFSSTAVVTQGRFSIDEAEVSMSGRLLSPNESTGLLTIPGCLSAWGWQAFK